MKVSCRLSSVRSQVQFSASHVSEWFLWFSAPPPLLNLKKWILKDASFDLHTFSQKRPIRRSCSVIFLTFFPPATRFVAGAQCLHDSIVSWFSFWHRVCHWNRGKKQQSPVAHLYQWWKIPPAGGNWSLYMVMFTLNWVMLATTQSQKGTIFELTLIQVKGFHLWTNNDFLQWFKFRRQPSGSEAPGSVPHTM